MHVLDQAQLNSNEPERTSGSEHKGQKRKKKKGRKDGSLSWSASREKEERSDEESRRERATMSCGQ